MSDDVDIIEWLKARPELLAKTEIQARTQLTARCAGFLEASHPSKKGSFVNYIHRSVREFLEKDEIVPICSTRSRTPDFNPNVAMMKACIHSLRLESPINPYASVSERNNSAMERARDFLVYAHHAESHIPSYGPRVAMVELFKAMVDRFSPQGHWFTENVLHHPEKDETFLHLAAGYYFRDYFIQELGGQEDSGTVASSLPNFILPHKDCLVSKGWPLPSVDMTSCLLQSDANPNSHCCGQTPWENSLNFAQSVVADSEHKILEDEYAFGFTNRKLVRKIYSSEYDQALLHRRYLKIMHMLVLSAADPKADI
jgi:hypothetical protein